MDSAGLEPAPSLVLQHKDRLRHGQRPGFSPSGTKDKSKALPDAQGMVGAGSVRVHPIEPLVPAKGLSRPASQAK